MASFPMQADGVYEEFHKKWATEQEMLKKKLICKDTEPWQRDFCRLYYVGGVDVSFVKTSSTVASASLVVCSFPDLEVVYSDCELVHLDTPYIPGFLAFREVGFFLNLLDKLKDKDPDLMPQVILVDGNGILHPRGFGIASHLGVLSSTPTVGVAKTLMQVDGIAKTEQFAAKVAELTSSGDTFPLAAHSGQVLGMAMRGCTKSSNPIFVSVGHQISLQTAVRLCHQCCKYRVAEPVRQADIRSREYLRVKFPETVKKQPKVTCKLKERLHHSSCVNKTEGGKTQSTTYFLDENHSEDSDEELVFSSLFDPP